METPISKAQEHYDGAVSWTVTPPPGIGFQTHKFSILDAVERGSALLRTDYRKHVETIIVGSDARAIVATLPHLITAMRNNDGTMMVDAEGNGKVGKIGDREIVYALDLEHNQMVVANSAGKKCLITLTNDTVY
jgi:hypothetical protein